MKKSKYITTIKDYTAKDIAEALGITYKSALNKLQGITFFNVNEMEVLHNKLEITYQELKEIVQCNIDIRNAQ